MIVRAVTDDDVPKVTTFLERHADTSLFLLSNLASQGPRANADLNSGHFKYVDTLGEVAGVFCLNRRGNLLVETAGNTSFAPAILDACLAEPLPLEGVLGEWQSAMAIWRLLLESGRVVQRYASREVLQRLDLEEDLETPAPSVRYLTREDFEQWEPTNRAYLVDEGIPVQGTLAQRRATFEQAAQARRWWGYFDAGHLVATTALNSVYKTTGQVGGVYTTRARRREGLARATMRALMASALRDHRLQKLILFTGESNLPARGLYASLGFREIGTFALLFGSPTNV